jgi:ribosomal protein L32
MAGEVKGVGRGGLCGKCGAPFPKRAKSVEKKPMRIFGLDTKATIRIYKCRACGERKAQIDATY